MEVIEDFLDYEFLDIKLYIYVLAFLAITAGFVLRQLTGPILKRLGKLARHSEMAYDEIVIKALIPPVQWGFLLTGIWLALTLLPLPTEPVDIERFVFAAIKGASTVLILWFGIRLTNGLTDHWEKKSEETKTKLDDQIIPIVRSSTKVFLVVLGIILVLQNLGYSVTSLIAGLGIGGAAVAFASKDTLSNLFGSLVIFLDRPFQIGDWIQVDAMEGVVEEVGLRTTKVRTFSHSLVTVPNAKFTTTNIENWSRMEKRRLKLNIGLTYDASGQQLKDAVARISELIEAEEMFHEDYHVYFDNMGSSSLDIFVYCFTKTTDYGEYLTTKQKFLLDIMDAMKDIGLEFAFPTQSIHVASLPSAAGGSFDDSMSGQRPR